MRKRGKIKAVPLPMVPSHPRRPHNAVWKSVRTKRVCCIYYLSRSMTCVFFRASKRTHCLRRSSGETGIPLAIIADLRINRTLVADPVDSNIVCVCALASAQSLFCRDRRPCRRDQSIKERSSPQVWSQRDANPPRQPPPPCT